jgi:hypothetical protein
VASQAAESRAERVAELERAMAELELDVLEARAGMSRRAAERSGLGLTVDVKQLHDRRLAEDDPIIFSRHALLHHNKGSVSRARAPIQCPAACSQYGC